MDTADTFTGEVSCPETLEQLIARLLYLRGKRKNQHGAHRAEHRRRKTLRSTARKKVVDVTGKRCHICGGWIDDGRPWLADHILAFSSRGEDSPENYLPAHRLCQQLPLGLPVRRIPMDSQDGRLVSNADEKQFPEGRCRAGEGKGWSRTRDGREVLQLRTGRKEAAETVLAD
jgi:hypothetical protein